MTSLKINVSNSITNHIQKLQELKNELFVVDSDIKKNSLSLSYLAVYLMSIIILLHHCAPLPERKLLHLKKLQGYFYRKDKDLRKMTLQTQIGLLQEGT